MATKQETIRELACFAGAGGGILAGSMLGWRTVCAVEWDAYAASILVHRQNDGTLPAFPIWDDIQDFDPEPWKGCVDVVSGGFPCTDISCAGAGAGIEGPASGMWRHMARIIDTIRPRYAFVENSPLLVGRGLADILARFAEMGYDACWGVLGARHSLAPHKRDRIWLVASDPNREGEPAFSFHDEKPGLSQSGLENTERAELERGFHNRGKEGRRAPSKSARPSADVADAISERGCSGNAERQNAVDANSQCEKRMQEPTAIQGENGWECRACGKPVLDGCRHYHGEWQCKRCGEWTYPFHYEPEQGCQACGSRDISYPDLTGLEGWPGHELCGNEPGRQHPEKGRSAPQEDLQPRTHWWTAEPALCGVADGMASRLYDHGADAIGYTGRVGQSIPNRADRLKCLGNGQVPATAALAWRILSTFFPKQNKDNEPEQ